MSKKTNDENVISVEENSQAVEAPVVGKNNKPKKSSKKEVKKENFFKRIWKRFIKFCKDTVGEMKKVTWTSKDELWKSTKLVLVTVVAIAAVIAVIDTGFALLINWLAGLVG
jgi:preprotein translocase subunit SecE